MLARILFSVMFAFVIISLQLGAWKLLYGSWFLYTYTGETFNWLRPELWNVLFSSYHGLFFWSPLYFIAFIGLIIFARRQGGIVWSFMIIFLCVYYINSSWHMWWYGWSFGARAFEGCVLFFMIGIATLYDLSRKNMFLHRVFIVIFFVGTFLNVLATYAAIAGTIPLEQPVTHKQMLIGISKAIKLRLNT